ncbi:MAG TPA: hypothetical protein VM124_02755 [Candidatus Limnocylindrales bacterium]|nr:hypothetical protein [Candidatus Limnocylindrales bacterium]
MIHAFLTLIFILAVTLYIGFEQPARKLLWRQNAGWIMTAVAFPIVGSILSVMFGGRLGNFLLHAVGGGMATAFIYEYIRRLTAFQLNWRLNLIGVFMLAAALGVLNELAEFAAELLHVGVFSFDTQDTWRDLAANTAGVLVAWFLVILLTRRGRFAKK